MASRFVPMDFHENVFVDLSPSFAGCAVGSVVYAFFPSCDVPQNLLVRSSKLPLTASACRQRRLAQPMSRDARCHFLRNLGRFEQ